ncbi:putative nucleotidyltransferase, Ribonuclease H [Arabidopsis thaliana]
MNDIFKKFLRKFVHIFFDDILIYSASLEEHIQHLELVFQTMREHSLFAKECKCEFATNRVEYLGHYITAEGVSIDPDKIKAVAKWPIPQSLKVCQEFWYYCKTSYLVN